MPLKKGAPDGYLMSKGYSYYTFTLLFLLYMFDYIDRMVVVSLFPFLKVDFGLSDTQCGLLVSTVYWSIVVLSVPTSVIIDRWSRKKSIGLMALFWSAATVACAFTKNFSQLLIARTAIGVGEAGYAPGGTAMISALFPEKMRSLIVGLWTAALPLGSAIGIMLGGYIATHYGWRQAFGIVALPGFIVAILFFFVRDYKTVNLERKTDPGSQRQGKMKTLEIVRQFTRTPSLLLTYAAFAGCMFLTASYLSWLPTYFHRVENLPMEKAAFKGSLVMLLAILGFPLGGFLVDRWRRKRINARLLFPALSSLITGGDLSFRLLFPAGPLPVCPDPFGGHGRERLFPGGHRRYPGCRASRLEGDLLQFLRDCPELAGKLPGASFCGSDFGSVRHPLRPDPRSPFLHFGRRPIFRRFFLLRNGSGQSGKNSN